MKGSKERSRLPEEFCELLANSVKYSLDNPDSFSTVDLWPNPNPMFNEEQIAMGIEVELEHTKDRKLAEKIAMDHLLEYPDYYTRLAKMEKEAEEDKKECFKSNPYHFQQEWRWENLQWEIMSLSPASHHFHNNNESKAIESFFDAIYDKYGEELDSPCLLVKWRPFVPFVLVVPDKFLEWDTKDSYLEWTTKVKEKIDSIYSPAVNTTWDRYRIHRTSQEFVRFVPFHGKKLTLDDLDIDYKYLGSKEEKTSPKIKLKRRSKSWKGVVRNPDDDNTIGVYGVWAWQIPDGVDIDRVMEDENFPKPEDNIKYLDMQGGTFKEDGTDLPETWINYWKKKGANIFSIGLGDHWAMFREFALPIAPKISRKSKSWKGMVRNPNDLDGDYERIGYIHNPDYYVGFGCVGYAEVIPYVSHPPLSKSKVRIHLQKQPTDKQAPMYHFEIWAESLQADDLEVHAYWDKDWEHNEMYAADGMALFSDDGEEIGGFMIYEDDPGVLGFTMNSDVTFPISFNLPAFLVKESLTGPGAFEYMPGVTRWGELSGCKDPPKISRKKRSWKNMVRNPRLIKEGASHLPTPKEVLGFNKPLWIIRFKRIKREQDSGYFMFPTVGEEIIGYAIGENRKKARADFFNRYGTMVKIISMNVPDISPSGVIIQDGDYKPNYPKWWDEDMLKQINEYRAKARIF